MEQSKSYIIPVVDRENKTIRLEAVNPDRRIKRDIQSQFGLSGRQWRKIRKAYQRLSDEEKENYTEQLRSQSDTQ